jgi:hypothetical protein
MQTSHQKIASSFGTDIDTVCSSLSTPITTNSFEGEKKKTSAIFSGKSSYSYAQGKFMGIKTITSTSN